MTTKSTELIEAATFISGKPDSILAGVWRQVVRDLKIDNAMLYEKVSMYSDTLKDVPLKRRTQIRGNMRTDVFKDKLTWYTFTKVLRILNTAVLSINFECKHSNRTSNHLLVVQLSDKFASKGKEKDKDKTEDGDSDDESPLSGLFAEMCFNLGVDYAAFEALLDFYMHRTGMKYSAQEKNELRARVRKEFRATKMSWNSLIKGFRFLCISEVKMAITLTYGYGMETNHEYAFGLDSLEDMEFTGE